MNHHENRPFSSDPIFEESSVELNINGLFIPSDKIVNLSFLHANSWILDSCLELSKMLGLSFDEKAFNSASTSFFKAGSMHWLVNKAPIVNIKSQSIKSTNTADMISISWTGLTASQLHA